MKIAWLIIEDTDCWGTDISITFEEPRRWQQGKVVKIVYAEVIEDDY